MSILRFSLTYLLLPAAAIVAPRGEAAPIDTDLGGFVNFAYAAERPAGQPLRADNALIDGEIHLELSGETDTGVTYGGRLQLLPAAKPGDNGTFAEIAWAWGELRLGDYGGAAKELSVAAPTIGIGQVAGDIDRFGGPSALIAPYALANDDSPRLTYFSPAILGFRVGLSYAPELATGGIEIVPRTAPGIDVDRNVVEFAIDSARDIGAVTVTTSATYVEGTARGGVHLHGLDGGSIGSKLTWNGLTIGGAFVYDGANTLPLDRRPGHVLTDSVVSEINFGVTYETGRWGFGLSFVHDDRKALRPSDIVALGAVYRLFQGVTVAADLDHFTEPASTAPGRRTQATALILRTQLSF